MSKAKMTGKYFHFDNDFWAKPLKCGFLDLYQIGELCCERGFQIEEHEQGVYEVTYVISGSGYAWVDGEQIRLTEGDVLVNAMWHQHAMKADDLDIFRYTYIGFRFNGDASSEEYDAIKQYYDERPYHLVKDRNDILFPFMRCMDEFYSKTVGNQSMIRNYCEQIAILATRDSIDRREAVPEREGTQNPVSSAVYSVIRYVEQNVCDISSIQDLAKTLGYNYTYLSHFFKAKTGTTLQKYITYKKLEKALQLLKYGELKPTQIAEKLNYESVQSFSKAFRRVMGFAPTKYMEMERRNDGEESGPVIPPNPILNREQEWVFE